MPESPEEKIVWACPQCGKRFRVPSRLNPPSQCRECRSASSEQFGGSPTRTVSPSRPKAPLGIPGQRHPDAHQSGTSDKSLAHYRDETDSPRGRLFTGSSTNPDPQDLRAVPVWQWFVGVPAALFVWGIGPDFMACVSGSVTGLCAPVISQSGESKSPSILRVLAVIGIWAAAFGVYFSIRRYLFPWQVQDEDGFTSSVNTGTLSSDMNNVLNGLMLLQSLLSFMLGIAIGHAEATSSVVSRRRGHE